ncbi:MAG: hypothetical protein ACR2LQ_01355 [Acidimicrobiales bacterium]
MGSSTDTPSRSPNRRAASPRVEADAGLHFEGDGNAAWGTKWVVVAARSENIHGRVILDVGWVPTPGGEAETALASFDRIAAGAPGVLGVIYDTALRGVHHQHCLRDLGWLTINRVAAASARGPQRKGNGPRVEKSAFVETKTVTTPKGQVNIDLFAEAGSIGIGRLTEDATMHFEPQRRSRTDATRPIDSGAARAEGEHVAEDLRRAVRSTTDQPDGR